ncbi:transcriptional coactivator p15/PC4 family protein [Aestuariivirga sp.]|uniref:transcriptional coactivator p15/PC4 family protein n=1 Tax=Aestuariivirga sp. TaxID=2650926 RepID=UPI003BAC402E
MTAEVIIASWPKNTRETLVVRLDIFRGQPIVDLRTWYGGDDGKLLPGRGGLTVSIRHLPALAEAIRKALEITGDLQFEALNGKPNQ